LLGSSFQPVHHNFCKPALDQVLSSHSIVSSSRTVRLCSPWGGRCKHKV